MAVMADPTFLMIVFFSFCIAGLVKGLVGLGLPTISLGLLTLFVDLPTAMVLLVMPALFTNTWQALMGGHLMVLLRRLWPFLLLAVTMVHVGSTIFVLVDVSLLERVLGGLLVVYAGIGLVGYAPPLVPKHETAVGVLCGAANGVLTGLTGTLFIPGVMYLQALGLGRDQLVQAMGLLFALATASLGLALFINDLILPSLGAISGLALLPAFFGMACGQRLRRRISEELFRKVFLIALASLGCYILLA
jgi:uncharacterized membrane protein YfcA